MTKKEPGTIGLIVGFIVIFTSIGLTYYLSQPSLDVIEQAIDHALQTRR